MEYFALSTISAINTDVNLEYLNLSWNTISEKYLKIIENIFYNNQLRKNNEQLIENREEVSKYKHIDHREIIAKAERDTEAMSIECENIKKHNDKIEVILQNVEAKEISKTKAVFKEKEEVDLQLKDIENANLIADNAYKDAENEEKEKVRRIKIKINDSYKRNIRLMIECNL